MFSSQKFLACIIVALSLNALARPGGVGQTWRGNPGNSGISRKALVASPDAEAMHAPSKRLLGNDGGEGSQQSSVSSVPMAPTAQGIVKRGIRGADYHGKASELQQGSDVQN